MVNSNNFDLMGMANAVRFLSADAVQKANSGHPGMPMGTADIATVLFTKFLKFDASDPYWPDRDRFILSAGHGSMLLYSLLYLTGNRKMTIEEIKDFRQLGSITAGHPEYGLVGGIETTTGPLAQGLGNAVGMAIAEKLLSSRFQTDIVDHYTYVLAGDGCLMEGLSHEAISIAGHLKLAKLIVLYDDNEITIDGPTSLAMSDDQVLRFEACGWEAIRVDGHNVGEIENALSQAKISSKPTIILCKTKIGFGAPNLEGSNKSHGAPLGEEEIAKAKSALNWNYDPFEVPEEILNSWREVGKHGSSERKKWEDKLELLPLDQKNHFTRSTSGELPEGWEKSITQVIETAIQDAPKMATRKASELVIEHISKAIPELVGGSADLTGSNNTKVDDLKVITAEDFKGRYIHWGVREHGMAAAMNGMALHGGIIPFGGTFLVFTDYCRPSIRLSALMGLRVIYIMTHDSIGLGEDGPTHQPIEHLASLRAMPDLLVFRPADLVETAECWQLALEHKNNPSVIALSRQSLPAVRTKTSNHSLSAKGGYIISETQNKLNATILATGSEVSLALSAREDLEKEGIHINVVSMPCLELFQMQDGEYKQRVLGDAPRIALEAGSAYGWEKFVGENGEIVGMNSFGASAPGNALFDHFSITKETIKETIKKLL